MCYLMWRSLPLVLGGLAAVADAQVTIGPNGIRSGDTVIDANGVHARGAVVTSPAVSARKGSGRGTMITTNGNARSIDCRGSSLTVNGNSNHLTVAGCRVVTINGNHNDLAATFNAPGRLLLVGNNNQVTWHAVPDVRVSISNLGNGNGITKQ